MNSILSYTYIDKKGIIDRCFFEVLFLTTRKRTKRTPRRQGSTEKYIRPTHGAWEMLPGLTCYGLGVDFLPLVPVLSNVFWISGCLLLLKNTLSSPRLLWRGGSVGVVAVVLRSDSPCESKKYHSYFIKCDPKARDTPRGGKKKKEGLLCCCVVEDQQNLLPNFVLSRSHIIQPLFDHYFLLCFETILV